MRETLVKIIALAAALLMVTSCKNIRPLYYNNKEVVGEMSAIEIEPIDSLLGSEIYYHLDRKLGARGQSKYQLQVISISDNTSQLVITDHSDVIKQNVSMEYKYKLLDKETSKNLTEGKVRMVGSYDTTASSYNSYINEKDLKKDLAETLANEIHTRLLLYFGNK